MNKIAGPCIRLANGVSMPVLGLGTWQVRGDAATPAVECALRDGYRLIDTAAVYQNEAAVGKGIRNSGLQRKDVFVTSKLMPADQGYERAKAALQATLEKLQTDYLDLYLIHWPGTSKLAIDSVENLENRKGSWRAFEEMLENGKVRAIGVSNYTVRHLEEMKTYAKVQPLVNQIEFHPRLYQKDVLDYCNSNGIVITAYSSLGTGNLVTDAQVLEVAEQVGKTAAQVLLRWGVQHGLAVIPKSTKAERIKENMDLFEWSLSNEQMQVLDSMHTNTRYCWDPTNIR